MTPFLRTKIAKLRSEISDRLLEFKPYIGVIPLDPAPLRFFFGTPQAVDWYDPLQTHTQVELEWMASHISGGSEKVIDAGAFHGLYTIAMAQAVGSDGEVVAIDPMPSNCALIEVNLLLNSLQARIEQCAVSSADGTVRLSSGSCGHIVSRGGVEQPSRRLSSILPDATVVKVDIEGEEFAILPEQIDAMTSAHTWNLEIHPGPGRNPQAILDAFVSRGFELLWVNRVTCQVERYPLGEPWTDRTSVIAVRQ